VKTILENQDGQRAREAGVEEGMWLASINGGSLRGWDFQKLVLAMKSSLALDRALLFVSESAVQQAQNRPHGPKENTETIGNSLGPKGGANTKKAESKSPPLHADPSSTPSRRRRLIIEVAKATWASVKKDAIDRAVRHTIETGAAVRIEARVRTWLATRCFRRRISARKLWASMLISSAARRRLACSEAARRRAHRFALRCQGAATVIQSYGRALFAHRELERRKKRRQAESTLAARQQAALRIQTVARRAAARRHYGALVRDRELGLFACIAIQSAGRRRAASLLTSRRRAEQKASRIVQRTWKGALLRRIERRQQAAAALALKRVLLRKFIARGVHDHALMLRSLQSQIVKSPRGDGAAGVSYPPGSPLEDASKGNGRSALGLESPGSTCSPPMLSPSGTCTCENHGPGEGPMGTVGALCESCGSVVRPDAQQVDSPNTPAQDSSTTSPFSLQIRRDEAATSIKRRYVAHLGRRRRDSSSLVVQTTWRRVLATRKASAARRLKAVLRIQTSCRRAIAKLEVERLRRARLGELRQLAVLLWKGERGGKHLEFWGPSSPLDAPLAESPLEGADLVLLRSEALPFMRLGFWDK